MDLSTCTTSIYLSDIAVILSSKHSTVHHCSAHYRTRIAYPQFSIEDQSVSIEYFICKGLQRSQH